MVNSWVTCHIVTVVLRQISTGNMLTMTSVYGPSQDNQQIQFIEELRGLVELIQTPWALVGDFNVVRFLNERFRDIRGMDLMCLFNNLVREIGIVDISTSL